MKLLKAASICLVIGIYAHSASGVMADQINASPAPAAQTLSPELAKLDEKVTQTKTQLDQARKQLAAAKALVKAASGDYKAAKAQREALALNEHAQSLVDEANSIDVGSADAKSHAIPLASKPPASVESTSAPVPSKNGGIDFVIEQQAAPAAAGSLLR